MSYVALYRSYRPKFFNEVVGQKVIVKTLQNALLHDKIAHAYIFNGPRGTGKTSVAKILAKAVNCLESPALDACGKCKNCVSIDNGEVADIIEIDAASYNQIDGIREIRDNVKYAPSVGKYKVYIIDEVHMLSTGGFNALLKTLEEPPKHVIFILATTEIHKLPPTILSRCQRFDFKNIDDKDIFERLKDICKKEKIKITNEAIEAICNNAEGGLRDALSLLDQVVSYSEGDISETDVHSVAGSLTHESLTKLLVAINKKESTNAINILNDLIQNGKEITRIVSDLVIALRDCLLEKNKIAEKSRYYEISSQLSIDKIYFYIDILNQLQNDIKFTHQKRAYIEVAIFKMMNHKIVEEINYSDLMSSLKIEVDSLKREIEKMPKEIAVAREVRQNKKPLVTVDEVEDILYNGNKEKKSHIQEGWEKLKNYPDEKLKAVAKLLSEAEIAATSENKILLTYKDINDCKQMLDKDVKTSALGILNKKKKLFDDLCVISKNDWDTLMKVFVKEYNKNKNPKPKLPRIDLKLYEEKKEIKEKKPEIIALAEEFFGKENITIKGD